MIATLAMIGLMEAKTPDVVPVDLFPDETDVRMQTISKQKGEDGWPFAADSGLLMCVPSIGQRVVLFFPDGDSPSEVDVETAEDRTVHVTTDPLFLLTIGRTNQEHYASGMSLEEKIRRLGPYVTLGKKLCDQPKGTILGPSEL
jgi:hypothetical protein